MNQREVGTDTADFHAALKRVLRQDPDVILVGEMRDVETVKTALTAAETGHLVFSTLHTISATDSINRIIDFFPPHEQRQVRMSLGGVAARHRQPAARREARRGGRVPAVEVLVATGRVFDKIVNADETHEIETDHRRGRVLRHADVRPEPARTSTSRASIDLREALAASTTPHDLRLMIEQHTMELRGRAGRRRPATTANHRARGPPATMGGCDRRSRRASSAFFEPDSPTQQLAARFAAAGHRAYLVGGSVRDALLDRDIADVDIATDARPDAIEALRARVGRRGVAAGSALRHGRVREGRRALRDHDVPRRRVPPREPQARGRRSPTTSRPTCRGATSR